METRQSKRRRLSERALAAPATVHSSLYFDALPRDALMVIIRHLCTRPYVTNWHSHVDPTDALYVLKCGGALTEVARSIFTSLDLLVVHQTPSTQIAALHTTTPALFTKLLIEQSPRLIKLSFATASNLLAIQADQFGFANGAYFEYCRQLRELTITDCSSWREQEPLSLEPILKACGGVLKHLHIFGNPYFHTPFVVSIIRHCRALESLSLAHQTVSVQMDQFWQVVGLKLKQLSCFPPGRPQTAGTALKLIARHCKHLEDVEILGHPAMFSTTSFYTFIGTRLRVLRLKEAITIPMPDVLDNILQKCPNVMVDIHIRKNAEALLRVLGPRVRNLELRCIPTPTEEFTSIADTLTALHELNVYQLLPESGKFVKALFNAPKPNLTKLKVDRVHFIRLDDRSKLINLLEVAANAVHFLHEFDCAAYHLLNNARCEGFMSSNRQLRRFKITYRKRGTGGKSIALRETYTESLVRLLVIYKSIVEFEVCFAGGTKVSQVIRNACVPLRGRELNLVFGNIQYLPRLHVF